MPARSQWETTGAGPRITCHWRGRLLSIQDQQLLSDYSVHGVGVLETVFATERDVGGTIGRGVPSRLAANGAGKRRRDGGPRSTDGIPGGSWGRQLLSKRRQLRRLDLCRGTDLCRFAWK